MSQQQAVPYVIELALATDRTQVGGRALHLQRALSIGMRITTGFVIPSRALTRFLTENGLVEQVNHYLTQATASSGKELRQPYEMLCAAVVGAPLPLDIAQAVIVLG